MVSIARHLNQYPEDGITAAVRNVLDFDAFEETKLQKVPQSLTHDQLYLINKTGRPGACRSRSSHKEQWRRCLGRTDPNQPSAQ